MAAVQYMISSLNTLCPHSVLLPENKAEVWKCCFNMAPALPFVLRSTDGVNSSISAPPGSCLL